MTEKERHERIAAIRAWFYSGEHGGGLLLGGGAHKAYLDLVTVLQHPEPPAKDVQKRGSSLRTELKLDLHVRQPTERTLPLPPSHESSQWRD